jgi:hypothetical protein
MKILDKKIKTNRGQAMILSVVFFIFISLATIFGLTNPTIREFKISSDLIKSSQSFFLSESGIEDAYYRLKTAKPIGSSTVLTLENNTVTTNIDDSNYNERIITSTGDVSDRERTNQVILTTGDGVSFSYGIQSGMGGFYIDQATVNGNVFSNGIIKGTHNGNQITGTAISSEGSGLIEDANITGNAQGHTVIGTDVTGTLHCQHGSGNNKACNTSLPDPASAPMPVTDAIIAQWKLDANINNDPISGNLTISTPTSLGPKKITGNLNINDDLTITGTIYVLGRITFSNGVNISLDNATYGNTGGILLTDGYIDLSNNVNFEGSGEPDSYIMLLTTSACPTTGCSSTDALAVHNNAQAVILNAQNGTAHVYNNVHLNEIVAKKIILNNGAEVNYLSGFASTLFSSGPSGGWSIDNWAETE